jgi:hypothetical protein
MWKWIVVWWKLHVWNRDSWLWNTLFYVGSIALVMTQIISNPADYGLQPWEMIAIRWTALVAAIVGGKNGNSGLWGRRRVIEEDPAVRQAMRT